MENFLGLCPGQPDVGGGVGGRWNGLSLCLSLSLSIPPPVSIIDLFSLYLSFFLSSFFIYDFIFIFIFGFYLVIISVNWGGPHTLAYKSEGPIIMHTLSLPPLGFQRGAWMTPPNQVS